MREFFQGWRRKAGLVTLAKALLLAVPWMRSYIIGDVISVRTNRSHHIVESRSGCLRWLQMSPSRARNLFDAANPIQWNFFTASEYDGHDLRVTVERRWVFSGFDFGTGTRESIVTNQQVEWWRVPYWSLVLPLTLLSAWLLLIKPRPAKSAKESSRA